MKKSFTFSLLLLFCIAAFAQTSLSGKVIDYDTGEGLIGVNIMISQNGNFITETNTDFYGNYKVHLAPGPYNIETAYFGFSPSTITGVMVKAGQNNHLDLTLGDCSICPDIFILNEYHGPLLSKDTATSGSILDQKKIKNAPSKNINFIAGDIPQN